MNKLFTNLIWTYLIDLHSHFKDCTRELFLGMRDITLFRLTIRRQETLILEQYELWFFIVLQPRLQTAETGTEDIKG